MKRRPPVFMQSELLYLLTVYIPESVISKDFRLSLITKRHKGIYPFLEH